MILPAQHIRAVSPSLITPFSERTLHKPSGMTYGLSPAGYDVRIEQTILLKPGAFALASTFERFHMPDDLLAFVHDKSTLARKGLAVQNTVIEPSWRGYLTLELTNHSDKPIHITNFSPIAQIVFHRLEAATDQPYRGRYQDQRAGPQPALYADESSRL